MAFRRPLQEYPANSAVSLAQVGLQYRASPFGPHFYFVYRKEGRSAGAFTTQIDDILGCGEQDVLSRTRTFLEARFRKLRLQEPSIAHVGMEASQADNYSVRFSQKDFSS